MLLNQMQSIIGKLARKPICPGDVGDSKTQREVKFVYECRHRERIR